MGRLMRKIASMIPGQYPYRVEIWRRKADGMDIINDKAKIVREHGINYLVMVNLGKRSLPPNASRFGKQYKFFEDEEGSLTPLGLDVDEEKLSNLNSEDLRTYKNTIDKAKKLYPIDHGLWTGRFAIVTVAIILLLASVPMFWMMYDHMSTMHSSTSAMMDKAGEMMESIERMESDGSVPSEPGNVTEEQPPGNGSPG